MLATYSWPLFSSPQRRTARRPRRAVEPTPRFYQNHPAWIWNTLKALEFSTDQVRISGFTSIPVIGHMGRYRASMWETHPVTKIEIFKNGQWVEY